MTKRPDVKAENAISRIKQALRAVWCGREDSNFHGLSPTTTSTLRVYQFRHDRIIARSQEPAPAG
jgi:hypothetical protein